jgi:hypothetical protein
MPCWRSIGRNLAITDSRALSSAIGSEREKSRIPSSLPVVALWFGRAEVDFAVTGQS